MSTKDCLDHICYRCLKKNATEKCGACVSQGVLVQHYYCSAKCRTDTWRIHRLFHDLFTLKQPIRIKINLPLMGMFESSYWENPEMVVGNTRILGIVKKDQELH